MFLLNGGKSQLHKLPPSPLLQRSLHISPQLGCSDLSSSIEVVLAIVVNVVDVVVHSVAAVGIISVRFEPGPVRSGGGEANVGGCGGCWKKKSIDSNIIVLSPKTKTFHEKCPPISVEIILWFSLFFIKNTNQTVLFRLFRWTLWTSHDVYFKAFTYYIADIFCVYWYLRSLDAFTIPST